MGEETEAWRDYPMAPGYKGQSWQGSLGSLTPEPVLFFFFSEPVLLTIILSSLCKRNHNRAKLFLAGGGASCVTSDRGGGPGGTWGHLVDRDFLGRAGFRAESEEVVWRGKPTFYTPRCRPCPGRSPARCPTSGCFRSYWTGILRAEADSRCPPPCELREVGAG